MFFKYIYAYCKKCAKLYFLEINFDVFLKKGAGIIHTPIVLQVSLIERETVLVANLGNSGDTTANLVIFIVVVHNLNVEYLDYII